MKRISTVGPKSRWGGWDRSSQTRPIPRSPDGDKKGLCQNGKKYFGFCCDNTALLFESIFGYSPEIRSQGMECVSLGPGRKKWILGFYPPRI